MAQKTRDERLAEVHQRALTEFDRVQAAVRDLRMQCLQARRFYSSSGAQWEGPLGDQFENKPRFEVNKVHLSLIRIFSEYRNNRITVDFTSKDGTADDQLADTCDGLYRADEKASTAEEAYDNAFEEGVGGEFGAWRLRAHYEDEEDEENTKQRVCIEPIFDADSSVFFDLDAKRQDKADAKRAGVITAQTPQGYQDERDDDPVNWPKPIHMHEFDGPRPDVVRAARDGGAAPVQHAAVVAGRARRALRHRKARSHPRADPRPRDDVGRGQRQAVPVPADQPAEGRRGRAAAGPSHPRRPERSLPNS
jgi:hypothetical protein